MDVFNIDTASGAFHDSWNGFGHQDIIQRISYICSSSHCWYVNIALWTESTSEIKTPHLPISMIALL
jgi:hypothetical protein